MVEKNSRLPVGLKLTKWRDMSKFVKGRLNLLIRNGLLGLALVMFTLWFFLDIRLAFWVAMGIPVSFAGALWIMDITGQSINMISMFGLLMAIGMIVDDAIVVGENVYTHIKGGEESWQAAINGTAEVILPVAASTLTTIAAFYPLFIVEGIMGKFIRVLPLAVIACLCASLFEAIFILPVHLRHTNIKKYDPDKPLWQRIPKLMRKKTDAFTEYIIKRIYAPVFQFSLDNRMLSASIAISVFLITVGLYKGGHIEFMLFPKTENELLIARVEFPYGTSVEKTRMAVDKIENAARRVNERFKIPKDGAIIQNISSEIGGQTEKTQKRGAHLAQVMIWLAPSEERSVSSEKIRNVWRSEVGRLPNVESLTFNNPQHGPGGKPIHIVFLGKDFTTLEKTAEMLKNKLASYPGVFDIEDSLKTGKRELRLSLKPEATVHGLTLSDLAAQIRHRFYGAQALRIQRGDDDLKVMVRYPLKERKSISNLDAIYIQAPDGKDIPLSAVADIKWDKSYAQILRQDGMRKVSVTAELDDSKNNAVKITSDLKADFMPELLQTYSGISYKFEGQQKERESSVGSLLSGFVLGLLIIYTILAVLFKSYFQPMIIMVSIPFGIVGAVLGHYIVGESLSLMSLFGIVGLSGIVVNDSLVLIDFVNKSLKSGKKLKEAVFNAGVARFRAVILTTVTTVAGLLPLLLEKSLQARFLIPMAISISFGLSFGTFITLFLVPGLYLILNDIKRIVHWLIFGKYPSPEQVEPYAFSDFKQ